MIPGSNRRVIKAKKKGLLLSVCFFQIYTSSSLCLQSGTKLLPELKLSKWYIYQYRSKEHYTFDKVQVLQLFMEYLHNSQLCELCFIMNFKIRYILLYLLTGVVQLFLRDHTWETNNVDSQCTYMPSVITILPLSDLGGCLWCFWVLFGLSLFLGLLCLHTIPSIRGFQLRKTKNLELILSHFTL